MPHSFRENCQLSQATHLRQTGMPFRAGSPAQNDFATWLAQLLADAARQDKEENVERLTLFVLEYFYDLGAPADYEGFIGFLSEV